jgi:hypothetical protein
MKIVIKNISGSFHCDACGFDEPAGFTIDKLTEAHIGHPCQQCGASTLSAEDYAEARKAVRWIDFANRWLGPLLGKEESQWDDATDKIANVSVNPRASGWTIKTGGRS